MKFKLSIFIIFIILSIYSSYAQNDINYNHKSLKTNLNKLGIPRETVIEAIIIPDSIYYSNRINGKYFIAKNSSEATNVYIYIGRVNSCRAGGCSVSNDVSEYSEYFDYFIIFDENKIVQSIKVFNYQASHGHEITAKGWLRQFEGYSGKETLKIDAVSGATISTYAITTDVKMKTNLLQKIIE